MYQTCSPLSYRYPLIYASTEHLCHHIISSHISLVLFLLIDGKAKPLTKPKAGPKDLSEEDIAFKKKQAEDKKAMEKLKAQVATKGFVKTKVGGK